MICLMPMGQQSKHQRCLMCLDWHQYIGRRRIIITSLSEEQAYGHVRAMSAYKFVR